MGVWTLFSNYGHVLVCLARNHEARLRDVAADVGITERAVQKIVRDLQDAGYVVVSKQGRCNRYRINKRKALRHKLEAKCTVGQLLAVVSKPGPALAEVVSVDVVGGETVSEAQAPKAEPTRDKKARHSAKKPDKASAEPSSKPVDTRQQGSLF